mmetsp:Transcript_15244/g.47551  ORF Transcript_15244/g.47551 Transcript_15244/m.47551 type:complete len:281 (-) Transcript_15244:1146-1988(-)
MLALARKRAPRVQTPPPLDLIGLAKLRRAELANGGRITVHRAVRRRRPHGLDRCDTLGRIQRKVRGGESAPNIIDRGAGRVQHVVRVKAIVAQVIHEQLVRRKVARRFLSQRTHELVGGDEERRFRERVVDGAILPMPHGRDSDHHAQPRRHAARRGDGARKCSGCVVGADKHPLERGGGLLVAVGHDGSIARKRPRRAQCEKQHVGRAQVRMRVLERAVHAGQLGVHARAAAEARVVRKADEARWVVRAWLQIGGSVRRGARDPLECRRERERVVHDPM